jgi:hypothetical protein
MRVGLGISVFAHVALLGFGFVAFPDAEAFKPEAIEALPSTSSPYPMLRSP